MRINYTHANLTGNIVSEVNGFIAPQRRKRVVILLKKVWQEKVDKSFSEIVKTIMDSFMQSGYAVDRLCRHPGFTTCYVNKKYYNAINYNGHVVKCTACDDIYDPHPKGILTSEGLIEWEDDFDKRCQAPAFENDRCLNCKQLPVCMGLCPREHMAGASYCKSEVMDEIYEERLLDFLTNEYVE